MLKQAWEQKHEFNDDPATNCLPWRDINVYGCNQSDQTTVCEIVVKKGEGCMGSGEVCVWGGGGEGTGQAREFTRKHDCKNAKKHSFN